MGPVNMVVENSAIISVQSLDVDYHTFSRSWKYPLGKISPFRAIKNLDLEILLWRRVRTRNHHQGAIEIEWKIFLVSWVFM